MQLHYKEFLNAKIIIKSAYKKLKKIKKEILISNKKDVKYNFDIYINKYIEKSIKKISNLPILSEENYNNKIPKKKSFWIIDPIDGSFNYANNFPISCISISLWTNLKPKFGLVIDINSGKLYNSFKKLGSRLDNKLIKVSNNVDLKESCLLTGFPVERNYSKKSLNKSISNFRLFKKIRMIGSATMSLCYVASGVFDMYYEEDIFLWDVAAGLSLVKESGGKYIINQGSSNLKFNVIASNRFIIKKFL